MEKKLYRSATDKKIWGICGGLAKYTGMDSNIMRIIFIVTTFLVGVAPVAYLIMYFVVPVEPEGGVQEATAAPAEATVTTEAAAPAEEKTETDN